MSLILEALRKSEIERRRAQTPDLYAEPAVATRVPLAASPRWLAWALATVAVVLLTGWLARSLWQVSPPASIADPDPARLDPAAAAPPRTPITSALAADARAMALADKATVPAPAPTDVAAPAPIPPAAIAPVPPRPNDLPPTADAPRPAPLVPPPANIATAAPISAPVPASPAAGTTLPSSDAPLRLADLSSEERRQLPMLKMSMHLWDAASAQRFVILDGERRGEGDRVGDAVIDEITRDGVVLAWQGRRLKLPIQ